MIVWLRQHGLALAGAFRHLLRSPGSFSLNVIVVAIALALPFAGLTLLENVRPVSEQLAVEPEISVFMAMDTPRERTTALAEQIRRIVQDSGNAGKLEFIPREHALSLLKNKTGLDDAITALGENPLPDGYVLKLSGVRTASDAAKVESLAAQLKSLPGVEYVQIDSAWVKRLAALMHVLRLALLFLAATLGVVVVAVIFNTIRLQVMTQRDEIEVCRMFGATDSYIYRPFYYTGALLGLCAGAAALGAVAIALHPLNDAIADFARLYASEFRLAPLGLPATVAMLATSAGLGLMGALLSVRRHLARLA
ncbi:permease-like cell division protein FtsX [Noviherbaspirillum sp.]|uniref:permease-like cell division protein FtsX n=1 Tax=Noviherbaspirillum sp. TaxID=1926288 RepID=UPI002D27CB91|nr:permease-like cell division protein FtsX [Noviherbaspirillum sp.]HZW20928.1 permease-like cell division protein FtsX [Noviherbaspirillum sp.]